MSVVEHYGVKGMKWGSRKQRKVDKRWQKNIYSIHGAVQVHNAIADRMNNGGLDKLNNQPKYKNHKGPLINDYGEGIGAVGKQYVRDYEKLNEKFAHEAVKEVHGVSPSGHLKAHLDTSNPNQWSVKITRTDVSHLAGISIPDLIMEVEHDERGQITLVSKIRGSMGQTIDLDKNYLEHYGKKGMRWGQRKGKATSVKKQSSDYKKVAEIRRKRPPQLTNKQLKAANERMNLEQNYNRMNPAKVSNGKKHAKALMAGAATGISLYNMATSNAGKAAIAAGKKALAKNAATAAAKKAARAAARSGQGTLF